MGFSHKNDELCAFNDKFSLKHWFHLNCRLSIGMSLSYENNYYESWDVISLWGTLMHRGLRMSWHSRKGWVSKLGGYFINHNGSVPRRLWSGHQVGWLPAPLWESFKISASLFSQPHTGALKPQKFKYFSSLILCHLWISAFKFMVSFFKNVILQNAAL